MNIILTILILMVLLGIVILMVGLGLEVVSEAKKEYRLSYGTRSAMCIFSAFALIFFALAAFGLVFIGVILL